MRGWYRGATPLLVDVRAGVDIATGLFSLDVTCVDTNTGALPTDPSAGFLPPNRPEIFYSDTNSFSDEVVQPGQGYITYAIKPRTNIATGTVVTNAASIVFDWNEPILTPTVFNTIDAGPPASAVSALAPESGRTFLVQWLAEDDFGGSGLASYDIYASNDGTNYSRWLAGSTNKQAYFTGELGQSYSFYSLARDWVGNEEQRPAAAQAFTFIPTNAPVLMTIADRTIRPGDTLVMTNPVTGTPVGSWVFALGAGAPPDASLNPTNGVFQWNPDCNRGNTTNTFAVWVWDSGKTNLTDVVMFTVAVSECVQPGLGEQVLRAGDGGRVPINLISSVTLTNLSMTVVVPPGHYDSLSIQPVVLELCSNTITLLSNGLNRLTLQACPGASLMGTQRVAWLNFTTISNQPSAFVKLSFTDLVGYQADGGRVANFFPQSGRVVIVGEEPLLECVMETYAQPRLVLYGKPGWNCDVKACPTLDPPTPWQLQGQATVTNLVQTLDLEPATNATRFFRAVRK